MPDFPRGTGGRAPGAVDVTQEAQLLRPPPSPGAGSSAGSLRRHVVHVEEIHAANHCLRALRSLGQARLDDEVLNPRKRVRQGGLNSRELNGSDPAKRLARRVL